MKGIEIRPPLSCSAPDEVVGIESSLVFGVLCVPHRVLPPLPGSRRELNGILSDFLNFTDNDGIIILGRAEDSKKKKVVAVVGWR